MVRSNKKMLVCRSDIHHTRLYRLFILSPFHHPLCPPLQDFGQPARHLPGQMLDDENGKWEVGRQGVQEANKGLDATC